MSMLKQLRRRQRKKKDKEGRRRRKQTSVIVSRYFPENIVEEILHKLPYDAIARTKLVCKTWNSLISSSKFIADHYNLLRLEGTNHLIGLNMRKYKDFDFYDFSTSNLLDNQSSSSILSPSQEPEKWGLTLPRLIGSFKGLVAISCHNNLILWNPVTKEYSLFPMEGYQHYINGYNSFYPRLLFGLCYDYDSEEYSVVVGKDYQSPPVSPSNFDSSDIDYESTGAFLYNLKDGSETILWDVLNRQLLDSKLFNGEPGKVIRGLPHWVVQFSDFKEWCVKTVILYFDLKEKDFKEMARPEEFGEKTLLGLAAMDGENQLGCVLHDKASSSLEVWVMKEYGKSDSWSNLFTFSDSYVNGNFESIRYMDVMGFMPNGELLIYSNGEELCVSNVENGNYRKIDLQGITINFLVTYQPRLISPPPAPPKKEKRTEVNEG